MERRGFVAGGVYSRRPRMPQRNALPGLIFVIIFAAGLLFAYSIFTPESPGGGAGIAIASFFVASIVANAIKSRQSVGAGRGAEARQVPLARRPRAVLHRADPRRGRLPDRHSRDHQHLQGRTDHDPRHRAGRRRRGLVLEGGRSEDGGARRGRLRLGDQLGGADGAARRDRQDDARRHARGPRED